MKLELTKKGRINKERVMALMKKCSANRRQWIINTEPTMTDLLEEFPCMKDHTMVPYKLNKGNIYIHYQILASCRVCRNCPIRE